MRKNVQALLSSFKAEMHTHVENINNLIISCDIFLCVWPRGQKPSSNSKPSEARMVQGFSWEI